MQTQELQLAYFSPTGTTKSIIEAIADGINLAITEQIDLTKPSMRERLLRTSTHQLLIVGVPVYIGRVPALLQRWLRSIKANKTPAVGVVVYGNRAFDDALLELKDILTSRGCVPIACAAYIGEHSFSGSETPIAEGRPDVDDVKHAESFGRKINERLLSISSVDQAPGIDIPGTYPYRGDTKLWSVDFVATGNQCTQCGICAAICPVGAISSESSHLIDRERCVTCCACIKRCPNGAKNMKPGVVKDAAIRLNRLHSERKQPTSYF